VRMSDSRERSARERQMAALKMNPYFEQQSRWLRLVIVALFATAANAIALTLLDSSIRSNPIVIAWTVGLIAADFVLLARWLVHWRRMWQEQNRIERRTSSDRAAARLAEILGSAHLPAKVVGVGLMVAVGLVAAAWRLNPVLAVACSAIALASSVVLAWSLVRHQPR
jgi:hypothetical protein